MEVSQLGFADTQGRPSPPQPNVWTDEGAVLRVLELAEGFSPVSRGMLADHTGLSDRAIRDAVERLVLAGWPVVSHSGRPGYELDWTGAEVDRAIADLESRGAACFARAKALRTTRERLVAA